jgi:hypothetical protein
MTDKKLILPQSIPPLLSRVSGLGSQSSVLSNHSFLIPPLILLIYPHMTSGDGIQAGNTKYSRSTARGTDTNGTSLEQRMMSHIAYKYVRGLQVCITLS